jgi:hypothetical protein
MSRFAHFVRCSLVWEVETSESLTALDAATTNSGEAKLELIQGEVRRLARNFCSAEAGSARFHLPVEEERLELSCYAIRCCLELPVRPP